MNKMNYSQDIVDRFWSKVNYPGNDRDCWLWLEGPYDTIKRKQYGRFRIDSTTMISSHIFSFQFYNGPIPFGLDVLHKCDTPKCVNPEHLFLGTMTDNNLDRDRKGRTTKGSQIPFSKLKEIDIENMLNEIWSGELICVRDIVNKYKISDSNIRHILNGKNWKQITSMSAISLKDIKAKVVSKIN